VDTTVIVKDSQTVVIGGLIDDSSTRNDTKVPVLGDIPVLGWLFRKRTETNEKTNLYIFLTPRVIKSPQEANEIFKNKTTGQTGTVEEGGIKLYEQSAPLKK
jgi:general secretion pathway protein D